MKWILTKGIGLNPGSIKYIILKGLSSTVAATLSQIKFVFGAISQSRLASVSIAAPGLDGVGVSNSTLSGVTISE